MPAPVPNKPQAIHITDDGAIIAWLGTYPAGTVFNTYWESGNASVVPSIPLSNKYSESLKSKTDSITVNRGISPIPIGTNVYVSVSSVLYGSESQQSDPVFLSICNSSYMDHAAVGRDESNANKMLRTDEKGRLFIVSDSNSPITVTESTLTANDPEIILVSNTSTPLPAIPKTGRQMLVIQNLGSTTLKLGLSGSEHFELDPRLSLTFTVGDSTQISGIRPSGNEPVCVWEYF